MTQPEPARYAITVAFVLRAEARGAFLPLVLANAAASLREEPECLRFDVLAPLGGGEADVFLYEIYATRAAFDAHLRAPHFREFDDATREMVTSKTVSEYVVMNPP